MIANGVPGEDDYWPMNSPLQLLPNKEGDLENPDTSKFISKVSDN